MTAPLLSVEIVWRGEVLSRAALPPSIALRLTTAAAVRGMTAAELAARLLEIIATDGLYDAVLDDATPADRDKG